jgi:hypothetical protein
LLPVTEFYQGCAKCKACIRLIRRAYYYDPETHSRRKEYERLRFQNSDRKAYAIEAQRRRRARYPEKYIAHNAVSRALRAGHLIRTPCVICGAIDVQAHHEDYSKPLEVIWLCFKHHRLAAHKQNGFLL